MVSCFTRTGVPYTCTYETWSHRAACCASGCCLERDAFWTTQRVAGVFGSIGAVLLLAACVVLFWHVIRGRLWPRKEVASPAPSNTEADEESMSVPRKTGEAESASTQSIDGEAGPAPAEPEPAQSDPEEPEDGEEAKVGAP